MRAAASFLLAVAGLASARAGTTGFATYADLCDLPEATLNGNAAKRGAEVRLTHESGTADQAGSLFWSNRVDLTGGGVLNFTFTMSGQADGFALVAQSESRYALGEDGSSLGFAGLQHGVAIEFDFVENAEWDDPDYAHVELHASPTTDEPDALTPETIDCEGFGCQTLWLQALPDGLYDGAAHEVSVTFPAFDPAGDYVLELLIDGGAGAAASRGWDRILLGPVNGSTLAAFDLADMYVGVTAGTTTAYSADVAVSQWVLQFPEGETTCMAGFAGDACAPEVPDNACVSAEDCEECTTGAYCCAWSSSASSCAAADADSDGTSVADCSATPSVADDDDDDSSTEAKTLLTVLAVLLSLALVAVNLYGRHRVRSVLAGGYGPISDDVRESMRHETF